MVKLHAVDRHNYLLLTEGFLPERKALRAAMPRNPKYLRPKVPKQELSPEEDLALTLSILARRMADSRRFAFGEAHIALQVPLDTWIVGNPHNKHADLAKWFEDESSDSTFRILVHRTPCFVNGYEIPDIWNSTYRSNYSRSTLRIHHKQINYATKQAARPFLEKMLAAYLEGHESVKEYLESNSYPYVFLAAPRFHSFEKFTS